MAPGASFSDYGPAYQYGVAAYLRFHGQEFDALEVVLERDWPSMRSTSQLEWARAREAARDAWSRVRV